ncbi:MAG: CIA30 family protein [Xanthomonadales bacterium]|nr:CIA30 family protein [Xanthomonadales bacterium]
MDWQIINDGVMGGLTRSSARCDDMGVHFSGLLSTANNGGFASIRSRLARPLRGLRAVRLSVTGDGCRYQLRLRDSEDPSAAAWRAFFETRGELQSLTLETRDFEPVVRGRRVEILPGLAERSLQFLGFMLASGKDGPFSLTIRAIELVGSGRADG